MKRISGEEQAGLGLQLLLQEHKLALEHAQGASERFPRPVASARVRFPVGLQVGACGDMFLCVRTTIDLNDELMRKAKRQAADAGITLREVFERALRAHLETRSNARRPYKLGWHPEGGKLKPGVSWTDFESGSRLGDLMDGLT